MTISDFGRTLTSNGVGTDHVSTHSFAVSRGSNQAVYCVPELLCCSPSISHVTHTALNILQAWGGNHMIMGGAVAGGKVHGQYLDDLTDQGSRVLSRGRVIPTLPWEAMWYGIAEWMGVEAGQMATVLPNAGNFQVGSTLLTQQQLFD